MLWYLFSTIISLSHQFDLGFSSTIIRFTSYLRIDTNKTDELKENYISFSTIYLLLSILVFLALIALYFISIHTLSLDIDKASIYIAYGSILFFTPLVFFLKKNDSFLKGLNKVNLYNNWNSFMILINSLIIVIMLITDARFCLIVFTNQLLIFLNSIKNFLLLKRFLSFRIRLFELSFNKNRLIEIWSPTWKTALISVSSTGSYNLINVLTPRLFGVDVSASYLFSIKILQIINELSNAPFYSRLPQFISNYKTGFTHSNIKNITKQALKSLDFLILGFLAVILFSDVALESLKSNTSFLSKEIIKIFLAYMLIERTAGMLSQIIMFTNRIEHYKGYVFCSIGLVSLIFIFNDFGVISIPASSLICYFLLLIYLIKLSKKVIEFDRPSLVKFFLRIVAVGIICFFV